MVTEGNLVRNHNRVLAAAENAGLQIFSQLHVCGRVGKRPLFTTYAMCRAEATVNFDGPAELTISVRDLESQHTRPYKQLLEDMGIPA